MWASGAHEDVDIGERSGKVQLRTQWRSRRRSRFEGFEVDARLAAGGGCLAEDAEGGGCPAEEIWDGLSAIQEHWLHNDSRDYFVIVCLSFRNLKVFHLMFAVKF